MSNSTPKTRRKSRRATPHKSLKPRTRDWAAIVASLSPARPRRRIVMGSAGSAQMTRARLLERWNGIRVSTSGSMVTVELES